MRVYLRLNILNTSAKIRTDELEKFTNFVGIIKFLLTNGEWLC